LEECGDGGIGARGDGVVQRRVAVLVTHFRLSTHHVTRRQLTDTPNRQLTEGPDDPEEPIYYANILEGDNVVQRRVAVLVTYFRLSTHATSSDIQRPPLSQVRPHHITELTHIAALVEKEAEDGVVAKPAALVTSPYTLFDIDRYIGPSVDTAPLNPSYHGSAPIRKLTHIAALVEEEAEDGVVAKASRHGHGRGAVALPLVD
jgi:hypothetical protein